MSRLFIERPFVAVLAPLTHLYGSGGIDRAGDILVRMLRVAVWFIFLLAGGFLVYTKPFVCLWVGPEYYAGYLVNGWIVSGYVVSLLTWILASACFSAGNIKGICLSSMSQSILYIPLLLGLGYFWGMTGIVAAMTLSIILIQGVYQPIRFVQYYHVKRSKWLPLVFEGIKALCITGALVVIAQQWEPNTWLLLTIHGVIFCVTYCVLLLSVSQQARVEIKNGYSIILAGVSKYVVCRG